MSNCKKNQPHYTEAMKQALVDIMEACHKEGKCFIAFNNKRTKNINIIISSECEIEPEPINEYEQFMWEKLWN